jgi:hypothetical protein
MIEPEIDRKMHDEYNFSPEEFRNGIRGKYAGPFRGSVNLVSIDPDLRDIFPDAEAVNQALRAMATVIRAHAQARRTP